MIERVKESFRKNKKLWVMLGIAAVVVYVIVMAVFMPSAETTKTGEAVVKYLKLKYNRDFEVKTSRYIWANKSYEFQIAPKNDPEFTFMVWSGMAGQSISETYLLMNEKRLLKIWVKPYLDAIANEHYVDAIGDGPSYVKLGDKKLFYAILDDLHSGEMTLEQILDKYPDKLDVGVTCYFGIDVTPENKDEILKSVYNLYKFLKDKKFGKVDLWLKFINKNKFVNNSLLETFKQLGASKFNNKYYCDDDFFVVPKVKDKDIIPLTKWFSKYLESN